MQIHLEGNNAPVASERDELPTKVVGSIPPDLCGRFYRNGPNPRTGWSPHLFAGDGMVHSLALASGRAGRYRNRYVHTPLYDRPGFDRFTIAWNPASGAIDHRVTTANTHIVEHAGKLLALEEGGLPYELTLDLDTVGPFTFQGRLAGAMTAHPKRCPDTGELVFFGYSPQRPFLTYYRASRDGRLFHVRDVELPACSLMHDFAITTTKAIFFDSSFVFDARAAASTGSPWRWEDSRPARIGVMDRDGRAAVRWFDVEPSHLSHAVNAYEECDTVVLVGTRLPPADGGGGLPFLHEWRIDLGTSTVTETPLDDVSTEYPRIADQLVGKRHEHVFTCAFYYEAEPDHGEIHKHSARTHLVRRLPAGHTCGEPVFVPRRASAAEDDGYVLTFAHDRASGRSYLLILGGTDLDTLAEVHLPVRVPAGFHGSWISDTSS